MTTVAYRDGIMAADSIMSCTEDGEYEWLRPTRKLFRLSTGAFKGGLAGTAGTNGSGLVFLKWIQDQWAGAVDEFSRPDLKDGEFTCLILTPDQRLLEYDQWLEPEEITMPFHAIGTGAPIALGAMYAGASAKEAVEIACKVSPHSAGPVVTGDLLGIYKHDR